MQASSKILVITNIIALILSGVALYRSSGEHGDGVAPAAVAGSNSVAFANFPSVIRESEAGKAIIAEAEAKTKELQDQAKVKLEEFKRQQSDIKSNRSLKDKDRDAKNEALQNRINDWNKQAGQRQMVINQTINKAMQKINDDMRKELGDYAKEHGYYAIIPSEQAFYFDKAVDITQDAIKIVNDKISAPKLDFTAEAKKENDKKE